MKRYLFLVLSFLVATFANAQLSGTYTINADASQNPSYTSFGAAANDLFAQGVSGPVLFEIAPGSYNEYVVLQEIEGTSETNPITFRGMGTDNQQVTMTYNAGNTTNATITLNGTDYVTFENMTMASTSDQKAMVVRLRGGNEHVAFHQVRFVGSVSNYDLENDKDLVHRDSGEWLDLNNEFIGCEFINGYIALYYQGHNIYQYNDGLVVENCTFNNQCSKSIYITFTDHVTVRGNLINNEHDIKSNYNAIDVYRARYNCLFENNVMNVKRVTTTNYAEVFKLRPCTGTEEEPVIVRNNIVNLNSNADFSYCYLFDVDDSDYIYFAHNTAKCSGYGSCGNIYVNKSWPHLYLYNNLLVNETNGYVFRMVSSNTTDRFCDYNRISFSGPCLARMYTTDYENLAEWNAATGFDANSALCTPQFVSANDLHITSSADLRVAHPLDYVALDIDDEPRSAIPCVGADEYADGANLPPIVSNPINDVVFEVYPDSQVLDLSNTFTDPDDPEDAIEITLVSNSNPELVSAVLDNRTLTLQRLLASGGSSTITLRATSNGQSVETSFSVTCVAEDLPPVVVNPLAPITFEDFPQTLTFDLSNTFDDPDNNNALIEITVSSCPTECTATCVNQMLSVTRNTPTAFTNKVLTLRATSNGKYVDMEVMVTGKEVVVGLGVADFEDVTLNTSGTWIPGQTGETQMLSGGWAFTSYYESYFWGGFSASNHTDLTQTGMDAQYTAVTSGGHDGSAQYAVAYTMGAQTEVSPLDKSVQTVTGCYVTNNLWAFQSITEGDYSATPFGGTSGNDPDWFKLTATGKNANGQTTGSLDFYLADYRFQDNAEDYVLNTWEWFDLSPLGPVASISFSLSSTKSNSYGMLTPAYFCMDDFNGIGPEAPDQPPYIANPVEDIVFNLFPQSIEVNLSGVASDPDDDDEAIVYSLLSNSNEAALSVSLTGKTLTLDRLSNEDAEAQLLLRANSDGQFIDFGIHVVMNHYVGVGENQVVYKVYPNPTQDQLHITVNNDSAFEYRLFNLLGQLVFSGGAEGGTTSIDVSACQEGIYFIAVQQEGNVSIEKIVIY